MSAGVRNTAIKRIQGDVREMMTNPSDQYAAAPLETNMFDWHFTLRGPRDTAFEGGVYHGRILLPADYPFKPPNIMLLTPNGRFEVRKKICLSISAYHPEEWQPAWGVRLILEALISFMPTKGEGAIGALDFSADERKRLAQQSVHFNCDTCGKVVDLLPALHAIDAATSDATDDDKPSKYAAQIAQLHMHSLEPSDAAATAAEGETKETKETKPQALATARAAERSVASLPAAAESTDASVEQPQPQPPAPVETVPVETATPLHPVATRPRTSVDTVLHYVTIACVVALFALVYKKLLKLQGVLP